MFLLTVALFPKYNNNAVIFANETMYRLLVVFYSISFSFFFIISNFSYKKMLFRKK